MRSLVVILALASAFESRPSSGTRESSAVVFPDDVEPRTGDLDANRSEDRAVITPPVLPVLEHLEHDPTTLTARALKRESDSRHGKGAKRGDGFKVSQNKDGGFTASFSNSFGGSSSQSHSLTANFNRGFHVSQSSSQSNSQNVFGSSGSHSSSQSSSFSAGSNGLSSSSSSSSALGGNILGNGFSSSTAQSNSATSGFGQNGPSIAFAQSSATGSAFGGQSFSHGQSSAGSVGNGAFSQAAGNGFGGSSNNVAASQASAQSSTGLNSWNDFHIPPISGNSFRGQIADFPSANAAAAASSIVFPGQTNYDQRFKPFPTDDPRTAFDFGQKVDRNHKRWRNGGSEQSIALAGGDWLKIISF